MTISEKTRKIIWIEAAGRCAICKIQVLTAGTGSDDPSVFGEEAHIVGKSPGGPRSSRLADELIDSHSNLILLCSRHHKAIDDQPNHFTVDRLRKIKVEHAAWAAALGNGGGLSIRLVPDPGFPQPVGLAVITRANPLWNMIKQSMTFEYAHPDHLPSADEDLIVEFLDTVKDYLDIASEVESVRENREVEKVFQDYIGRLAERHFFVGALVRHMLLIDSQSGTRPWPMFRVEVQPAAEARITDTNGVPLVQPDAQAGASSSTSSNFQATENSSSTPAAETTSHTTVDRQRDQCAFDVATEHAADEFRTPFVGHLPGFLAVGEQTGSGRPSVSEYARLLMLRWTVLLDSPASHHKPLLRAFFEHHPALVPGGFSVDGDSGHASFPLAVISKPKLPGFDGREPDFMWIATDSSDIYPILIGIETPHTRWFREASAEVHGDFTRAQERLAEWRAWFGKGSNSVAFLDYYMVPEMLRRRRLRPRFVLIYGRRAEYEASPARLDKRAHLAREDERLMSFDRLTVSKSSELFSCVRKDEDGYRALTVPPAWSIINNWEDYAPVAGWDDALNGCLDMADARRSYLKDQLRALQHESSADTGTLADIKFRRVKWL